MTEFRKLVENYLEQKTNNNLEEGKFGKFLGTMATAAALGFGGLHSDPAQAMQNNPINQEQIMDYKFSYSPNAKIPDYVKRAGKLAMDSGKLYFINEIVRPSSSDNTAQLERAAGAEGGAKLLDALANAVNDNLDSSMNPIGDNFKISSMVPQGSFWLLAKGDNGPEYHAYAKIRVDQSQIEKTLVNAVKQANPKINNAKIQKMVKSAIGSLLNK